MQLIKVLFHAIIVLASAYFLAITATITFGIGGAWVTALALALASGARREEVPKGVDVVTVVLVELVVASFFSRGILFGISILPYVGGTYLPADWTSQMTLANPVIFLGFLLPMCYLFSYGVGNLFSRKKNEGLSTTAETQA